MYEKFEQLDEESKKRILEAALEVFSDKGYINASTNDIVKKAGISKGALFFYFKSKKDLYLYLLEHTINYFIEKMKGYPIPYTDDFFDMIIQRGVLKMKISLEESVRYKLVYDAYVNTPDEIKKDIRFNLEKIFKSQKEMIVNLLKTQRIRDCYDIDKVTDIIFFAIRGMYEEYIEEYKGISAKEALVKVEKTREHMQGYFNVIKKAFFEDENNI